MSDTEAWLLTWLISALVGLAAACYVTSRRP